MPCPAAPFPTSLRAPERAKPPAAPAPGKSRPARRAWHGEGTFTGTREGSTGQPRLGGATKGWDLTIPLSPGCGTSRATLRGGKSSVRESRRWLQPSLVLLLPNCVAFGPSADGRASVSPAWGREPHRHLPSAPRGNMRINKRIGCNELCSSNTQYKCQVFTKGAGEGRCSRGAVPGKFPLPSADVPLSEATASGSVPCPSPEPLGGFASHLVTAAAKRRGAARAQDPAWALRLPRGSADLPAAPPAPRAALFKY